MVVECVKCDECGNVTIKWSIKLEASRQQLVTGNYQSTIRKAYKPFEGYKGKKQG